MALDSFGGFACSFYFRKKKLHQKRKIIKKKKKEKKKRKDLVHKLHFILKKISQHES